MTSRHRSTDNRRQGTESRVDTIAPAAGIVQHRDQGEHTPGHHENPLRHAQGAGLQVQVLLQENPGEQHGDDSQEQQSEKYQPWR